MLLSRVLKIRYLTVVLVVLVLAASAYAFAAQNTVDVSGAGDGDEEISGYEVEQISYTLGSSDPTGITAVEFLLTPVIAGASAPKAGNVKVKFDNNTNWFNCTLGTTKWSCTVSGVTVVDATNLRVVAAQ